MRMMSFLYFPLVGQNTSTLHLFMLHFEALELSLHHPSAGLHVFCFFTKCRSSVRRSSTVACRCWCHSRLGSCCCCFCCCCCCCFSCFCCSRNLSFSSATLASSSISFNTSLNQISLWLPIAVCWCVCLDPSAKLPAA